jgi:acetylornithine deacetylase
MTTLIPSPVHDALTAYFHSSHSSLKQSVINELAKWIQFDSLAGNEAPIQHHIQSQLVELGLQTDLFYLNDIPNFTSHPHFVSPRTDFSKSPNLVGILKSKNPLPNGKSLILNGHIDVVPVGALNTWTKNPFGGEYDPKDDKLYGRGVTDMKAGLYACMLALRAVIKSGILLGGDVIVESVVEEESGGAGTLAAILKGYKADGAIISEPTSTKIFPIQQGSMWFRIKVQGRGAHGGTRYEGVSAIEKAMIVVAAILELEKKRNDGIAEREVLFKGIPIPVPINVGRIEGGKWPSSVPDEVILEGRMGIIRKSRNNNLKKHVY